MATLEIFNIGGKKVSQADFSDAVFATDVRRYLLSEVVNWQRACRRAGTQSALTKGEVTGSTKKPFPQKGRGTARQGSARKNPHQIGGGVAFAPKPRDYSFTMPKSKKRAALASAISSRVKEGRIRLIDALAFEEIKTKKVAQMVADFGVKSCLVVDGSNDNLKMSARNHADVKFLQVAGINVLDILRFPYLLMTVDAARSLEESLVG